MIDDVAFFSEQGVRAVNQDAIYASAGENRGIFVVADGMGGHSGGEIASDAIVKGIKKWWDSNEFAAAETTIDQVAEQCRSLLMNINTEVFTHFSTRGQVGGSTVAVLIVWEDRYIILSAGDSRVYRIREKVLEQLTVDDVWENLPEVKYEMSNEQVVCDFRFGMLTEALGSEERLKISKRGGMLTDRERFLLCSDGVYKYCAHTDLERIMCRRMPFGSADKRAEMIRKRVLESGVEDNYSAIICSVRRAVHKLDRPSAQTGVNERKI